MNRREAIQSFAVAGIGFVPGLSPLAALAAAPQSGRGSTGKVQFPKGAIIRHLLKDEPPENLGGGALLWHEHVMGPGMVSPPGAKMTDEERVNLLAGEFNAAKKDGVACLFATTHARWSASEVAFARNVAMRSELPFALCGARAPTIDPWWKDAKAKGEQRAVDELAEDLYKDSVEQRWAAIGEIATWAPPTTDFDRWYMKAVAKVHLRTNLRIFTHTPPEGWPSSALEQLDLYESLGVDPRHLCIGHLSMIENSGQDPDWVTHRVIAKRGAYIGFDNFGETLPTQYAKVDVPLDKKVRMVLRLLDAGYEDRMLFSSDQFSPRNLKANNGPGIGLFLAVVVPKLRAAGVNDALIRKMTVDNPRQFFAFVPKRT